MTNKTQNSNFKARSKGIYYYIAKRYISFAFCILSFAFVCLYSSAYAVSGTTIDPSRTLYTARQVGMGGLSVAFSDDANGVFSNPAGLSNIEFPQLTGTSRKLLLDETQYLLFGWAFPTKWGTFGLGYTGMNTGGSLPTMLDPASHRIIIDPSREAMSYDNSVIALSYANQIKIFQSPEKVSLGGNLKIFNQSLSGDISSNASGIGIDLGATYKPLAWLTVGANLQNLLEGNLEWEDGESDKIGGFYKLGCKVNILGEKDALYRHSQNLYGGIDIDLPHSTLSSTNYHLGVEYFPLEKIALRAGLNMEQNNGTGLTLGVGFENSGFRFDYAFAQRPGIPGDAPHYFSLSYVGERVVSTSRKLKNKVSAINFIQPKDRYITDQNNITITVEAHAKRIMDQKTTWTVTAISATHEVKEVAETENLNPVYLNGIKLDQVGTIEASSPLNVGRNVFQVVGYTKPEILAGKTSPEVITCSSEAKVLRIKPFSDTPMTHWAIEPIALSVTLGLVKGYPDGTFRPERGITRAELVTLLVRTLPVRLEEAELAPFTDVPETHWASKHISHGSQKKLITGYPDGTFKPSRVLTRAEGVTILARYAGLPEKEEATPPFPDLKPDYWANKYIGPARAAGMLKYLEGKDFEPNKPFPRAEACEVLYRTPQVIQKTNDFWEKGIVGTQ